VLQLFVAALELIHQLRRVQFELLASRLGFGERRRSGRRLQQAVAAPRRGGHGAGVEHDVTRALGGRGSRRVGGIDASLALGARSVRREMRGDFGVFGALKGHGRARDARRRLAWGTRDSFAARVATTGLSVAIGKLARAN
jgi:hypothetical protein